MGCWKTNAKNEFDSWSRSYDRSVLQRIFFGPSHDLILSSIDIPENARILDVGCGTGLFANRLAHQLPDAEIVGLDLSPGMLEKAEKNCTSDRIRFVEGDSEHLPFDDNSFDVITCVHSFHHYPNQEKVVQEMYRVSRPDGQVCVVDGNRDGWWGYFVFDWVVTTIEGLVHHCSAREFRSLYAKAGLKQVNQYQGGHIAPFLLSVGKATTESEESRLKDAA